MVGPSIINFIEVVWSNHSLILQVNNTLLVLILKIDHPEFINQFRPIALCNVIYKYITKILVGRIKPFLDEVISPFRSSFVPGRNIHDNIIIAKAMIHSMRRMKGGARNLWPLKLI